MRRTKALVATGDLSSAVQGQFFALFRGCRPPLAAARSLTLWTLSNEPGLPRAKDSSLPGSRFSQVRSGTEPIG